MATGSTVLPPLHPVAGVRLGSARAGIKPALERDDMTVLALDENCCVAAVFTQNTFCAAPVQIARAHLGEAKPQYLLINTGNANAGTGEQGINDARQCCDALADLTGVSSAAILPFSTGVIGEHLPTRKIVNALPQALADCSEQGWERAASAILTTDTRPKGCSRIISIDGRPVTVTGIAKGSGMIHPNMATMLAYIATDAPVCSTLLQTLLNTAVAASFNRITVDGDTSTNDACVLISSGRSGHELIDDESSEAAKVLASAIKAVAVELAQAIVRDGEGATKFVTVRVEQGRSVAECEQVAFTVAHSPLVKTALFASDANWGRILAAVGRSGVEGLDANKVSLFINDVLIADDGARASGYSEAAGTEAMAGEDIVLRIGLGRGSATAEVWTSDLSHEYVTINAEYRT